MERLALFMTLGGSLAIWRREGILERELALYAAHAQAGIETTIVSYGDNSDLEIAAGFPFVCVLVNDFHLHPRIYNTLMPWLHRGALKDVELIKTNQLAGAGQALRAGRLCGRPVVIRQGYGYVDHTVRDHGPGSRRTARAMTYEKRCLKAASLCQFTTEAIAADCLSRTQVSADKSRIVPNYVDDEYWSPAFTNFRNMDAGKPLRIGFFGRFADQKNLENLIDASAGEAVELLLIGDGPLRHALAERAVTAGVPVTFPGRLDHTRLREAMAACDAFALVSHYEGHPKALIEAMTFGMPVIAADSPGISALIDDGRTGLLASPTIDGIRSAIQRLRALSVDQRATLSMAARKFASERFSVQAIARREQEIFEGLLATETSP